jgi:two-component system, NtrC family, nitrogen regulation response regulator GlnG
MSAAIQLLIADDDDELTKILNRRFMRLGAQVTCCSDAKACLALFASQPPDVVLIDGKLPGNEGLWLVRQLRTLSPDIPLVMLSGNDDRPFAAAAYEAGVLQFLLKPCSLAAVEAAVLKAAERRQERPAQVVASLAETLT